MHEYKHVVYVNPRKIHSSLDYLHRKMPIATCVSGHTALLRKRETRLHTWRPCPATAAVYRSHGHTAACVGEGAQFQLGLPDICVESVVVPDRNESFALTASQELPRSGLMQSCRRGFVVINLRVIDHRIHPDHRAHRGCLANIDSMYNIHYSSTEMSYRRLTCPQEPHSRNKVPLLPCIHVPCVLKITVSGASTN